MLWAAGYLIDRPVGEEDKADVLAKLKLHDIPEGVSFSSSLRAGIADMARVVGGFFGNAASKLTGPRNENIVPMNNEK